MAIEITMPRLSDTMEQGTIVKWNVKEGDTVTQGDVIADIETDKATMELEAFDDGIVASLPVPEGKAVPVGSVIMVLAEDGESTSQANAQSGASVSTSASAAGSSSASTSSGSTAVAEPPSNGSPADRVFASPLARKIATEKGLDLSQVQGSGPSGRIVRKDVESITGTAPSMTQSAPLPAPAAPTQSSMPSRPAPQPVTLPAAGASLEHQVVPLSTMRGIIASRLVESKTTIPHYQVTVEVDMDALMALRVQLNAQLTSQGVKLTVNDFLVRACALAMHQHPFTNSRWIEPTDANAQPAIEILPDINIGVAIALPSERGGGLVVASLRNADQMGLRQISAQTKYLATKAREKGLSIDEMQGSTFTISNLGMFGVDHFTAIINPPNAAILAVGSAMEKPVVRDGQIVPGKVMSMTMSSDHRIIDGAMAGAYLAQVKALLEAPATLLV